MAHIDSLDYAAFEDWRKREFPFFQKKVCLTHASVSPLPAATAGAIAAYAQRISTDGQFDYVHDLAYQRCKKRIAALIGPHARAEEVAFASSTSHALGLVATSLPWKPGDNCVVAEGDFPANVVTWKNLEHTHGVEVRTIPHRPVMDITLEDLAPLVDERTRIVSLSAANFLSGYPLDTLAIGQWLHERGVLFCIDGIQMLGAVPFDTQHVDFVCADSHKWLLSPNGIAALWVRGSVLPTLRPMILGWLATKEREDWYAYGTTPRDNADCFEPGARNYLGIVAFDASLSLLAETGAETVARRCSHLRDYAAQVLERAGCQLLWRPEPTLRSGIVSFHLPGTDTAALYRHLDEKFALSLRKDREGKEWIRVSGHFMNHEADLDALGAAITAYSG